MEPLNESLFGAQALESPAALASSLAPAAAPGHFDELRGEATRPAPVRTANPAPGAPLYDTAAAQPAPPVPAPDEAAAPQDKSPLTPAWSKFFEHLGSCSFIYLPRRAVSRERQIRDNSIIYNVYAHTDDPQLP